MITKSMTMVLASALVAGCSAEMMPPGGGDGGGSGSGSGSNDGTPGAYFVESTVRDERADMITFTADGPVHAHGGEAIKLGGSDCPAVYKHAYLLDQAGPRFGSELAPNPLAWALELEAVEQLDLASSAYRVRTAGDQLLLDWTPLPAAEGDLLTISLHRHGDVAIPALGEYAGELFIDVRTVDLDGAEKIASACWNHQPLAAPLEIERPRPVADPGLVTTTFTGVGGAHTVASVINGATTMPTFMTRITQYTGEPVRIALDVAAPTAAYTAKLVDDYVAAGTTATSFPCGTEDFPSTDPRCDTTPPADPADATRTGTLASTRWTATLVNASTGVDVETCTVAGDLRVTCELPPRAVDGPARVYVLRMSATSFADLFPPATPIQYLTIAGQAFVGTTRTSVPRCNVLKPRQLADGTVAINCIQPVEYARIFALDTSTVTIAPFSIDVQTSPAATLPFAPTRTVSSNPLTWDTGNADLPGAQ